MAVRFEGTSQKHKFTDPTMEIMSVRENLGSGTAPQGGESPAQQQQQHVQRDVSADYLTELSAGNGTQLDRADGTDNELDPCVQLCAHPDEDKDPDYEPQGIDPSQGYIETTTTTRTTTITCVERPGDTQLQGTSAVDDDSERQLQLQRQTNGQPEHSGEQMAGAKNFGGLDDLEALLDDYDKHRYGDGTLEVRQQYTTYNSSGRSSQQQRSQADADRPTVESLLGQLDIDQRHTNGAPVSPGSGERSPGGTLRARFSKSPTGELTYTWSRKSPGPKNADLRRLHQRDYSPQRQQRPRSVEEEFVDAPEVPVRERARHYEQQLATTTTTTTTSARAATMDDPLDSMLGNLSADMVKHGVSTIPKGECAACGKTIVGQVLGLPQVVIALGKMWHPEHFVCVHCGEELGEKNFYERAGKGYCEADYHDLFAPRCAHCDGPIKDRCVTALDRTWHVDHFFCAQCGADFGDDGFHEKDGKAFCRNCYFGMFAPRCHGCKKAITNNYITAINTHWHPECFVCQECGVRFDGGSFFAHQGRPYCERHYHQLRGTLCHVCAQPIAGRCVTAMNGRRFHPEHFVCTFCRRELNKGTFKEHQDKPYCHKCFEKLLA